MTSISDLQPKQRLRVYDLVREAGIDVSDWSNYSLPNSPERNPKYCYEWSFVGSDRVVVCLWFAEMRQDADGIFQELNYVEIPAHRAGLSAVQKKRRGSMNLAFRVAHIRDLPVRTIIVDGPVDDKGDRSVERRSLDPEPWHVADYDDDTGLCLLRRGGMPVAPAAIPNNDTLNDLAGLDLTLLGRDEAEQILKTVSGVKRDSAVRRAVIRRCNGTCERPGCLAKRDFPGFLDVHHILGAEKSDRPWTCIALCPNCHREAHFASERDELNAELLAYARRFIPIQSAESV